MVRNEHPHLLLRPGDSCWFITEIQTNKQIKNFNLVLIALYEIDCESPATCSAPYPPPPLLVFAISVMLLLYQPPGNRPTINSSKHILWLLWFQQVVLKHLTSLRSIFRETHCTLIWHDSEHETSHHISSSTFMIRSYKHARTQAYERDTLIDTVYGMA